MREIASSLLILCLTPHLSPKAVAEKVHQTTAAPGVRLSFEKTLNIEIVNSRAESVSATSHAEFHLLPEHAPSEGFWAPVDLRTRVVRSANERDDKIRIPAKGKNSYSFQPDTLRWAKEIAAVWRDQPLVKVAPPGAYVLTVRVGEWVSNPVVVHVHYSGQLIPVKVS